MTTSLTPTPASRMQSLLRWTSRFLAALCLSLVLLLVFSWASQAIDAPWAPEGHSWKAFGWVWTLAPSWSAHGCGNGYGYIFFLGGDPTVEGTTLSGPYASWNFCGIKYINDVGISEFGHGNIENQFQLSLPPWFTLPLLLAFPLYWLSFPERHRRRQRLRRTQGLCPTCAYDLRTHLEGKASPNCPECGHPLPQAHTH